MNEKAGTIFSIAKENEAVSGCTISKLVSKENGYYISHFSLAKDTDISAEIYHYPKLWIVLEGTMQIETLGKEKINIKIEARKKAYDEVFMIQANTNTSLDSVNELKKTIKSICNVDDSNSIELASSLFEKIIVETDRDKEDKRKAVLHCQLKITDSERHNLPLSQLSLLMRSDAGICRS